MRRITLNSKHNTKPIILVFVEGTILKPKSWHSLYNHNAYVPIGNAVKKISAWQEQGATIVYCTSRRNKQADTIADLLKQHGFVGAFLAVREQGEKYKDIVELLQPDVLIEDDCKSIGGAWQMCITKVSPEIKSLIHSVVVPEFKGIDHLPTYIELLAKTQCSD